LGIFSGYTFTGLTPIRTGRATMAVWVFFGRLGAGNKVFHIVLEDFFVLSFLTSSSTTDFSAYCTANHIYHNRFPIKIEDTTGTNFSANFATYRTADWTTEISIPNLNKRWVHVRCGVDYTNDSLFIDYAHRRGAPLPTTTSSTNKATNTTLRKERLYNPQATFADYRFYKFYKPDDKISVYIKNINEFDDNNPVFLQNLYIFSEPMDSFKNIEY
jgi:hypothetical protein